jgi:hypothetical protein
MRTRWVSRTLAAVVLAAGLSGCIYQPAPGYYAGYPAYPGYAAPVYPAPVYAPAPYYGTLNLGFGDGWHRGGRWR